VGSTRVRIFSSDLPTPVLTIFFALNLIGSKPLKNGEAWNVSYSEMTFLKTTHQEA